MSKLFYTQSAGGDWNQALPIGNGKLGAMIYGTEIWEHLQLNEDSLWYGDAMDRINPDAAENLEKVRRLIFEGNIPEAEELLLHAFSGTPASERPYSCLGEIYLHYHNIQGECEAYRRELDLERAVHTVTKTYQGTTYVEETFANAENNVIVMKISTTDGTPFDLSLNFARMCFYDSSFHDDTTVYCMGKMVGEDYRFAAGITAFSQGGSIVPLGEYLCCKQVEKLCVLFTAATTYREREPLEYVRSVLGKTRAMTYAELYDRHIRDYQALFGRTRLTLASDPALEELPTNERLARIDSDAPDNGLITTYFDFGRYLLISSSRPGSLPANLQGIWNKDMDPPWGCKFTVNINTQMNYWPAEMLGLSECQLPLFEHMLKMCENGRKTAREMYRCRGTVCHHNTDLWGDTAPQDTWIPGTYWVMSLPWLCTHVWEHYLYTKDLEFLRKMYPVVKESVLFFHDFLIETEDEALICPSVSPENTYILPSGVEGSVCAGSTMDNEILRDHFTQFLEMASLLEDDDFPFILRTRELLAKLPPLKIGSFGQIMEWREDYKEKDPGHRHISHLYALHPSSQITVDGTPELAEAASVTLRRRLAHGGGHTGWSRAWIMNMYARLWDGEKTYENLLELFKRSTLGNLFDNHPPFQIDGNFGSVAAIGEMLLQSNSNRIVLLPALPKEWPEGKIDGIYARGGVRFRLSWKDGKLQAFTAKAVYADFHETVQYGEKFFKLDMQQGEEASFEIYEDE
ncbi:MAG: glycoside hydrolase N-terminal domain-containing protein [Lachnospiraceae bacterium]|nr:glycoside hydrolase N-terminal domain-containing protein [Lachnospiraceae bacterium]